MIFFDLVRFEKVRRINMIEWASYRELALRPNIPRKLKCVSVYEDYENGGTVAVGTSFGDVFACSLGTTI